MTEIHSIITQLFVKLINIYQKLYILNTKLQNNALFRDSQYQ